MFEEDGVYGVAGIKDRKLLESSVESIKIDKMFNTSIYPTILIKAAQLWLSLAKNHCFANGNKMTSLLATIDFLNLNCYTLDYDFDDLYLYEYTKSIIENRLSNKDICDWLLTHAIYDLTYVNENMDITIYKPIVIDVDS